MSLFEFQIDSRKGQQLSIQLYYIQLSTIYSYHPFGFKSNRKIYFLDSEKNIISNWNPDDRLSMDVFFSGWKSNIYPFEQNRTKGINLCSFYLLSSSSLLFHLTLHFLYKLIKTIVSKTTPQTTSRRQQTFLVVVDVAGTSELLQTSNSVNR